MISNRDIRALALDQIITLLPRIEGHIVGFDEYMNLVLDDSTEVHLKRHTEKALGRIMLKGDNITLIQAKDN